MSRTKEEIKADYEKHAAAAGALAYQIEAQKQQLNGMYERMSGLNDEMLKLQATDQPAPKLASVPSESAQEAQQGAVSETTPA